MHGISTYTPGGHQGWIQQERMFSEAVAQWLTISNKISLRQSSPVINP